MIDDVMFGFKIVLVIAACLEVKKLSYGKKGVVALVLIGMIGLIGGMEMATNSETPWQYLVGEADLVEWAKALGGGLVMLILPVLFHMMVGKDIIKKINDSGRKHEKENHDF